MDSNERNELESSIRTCLQRGDLTQAAELGIRGYRSEILKLLSMELRDPTAVADVFSVFCENIWKGIAGFRGDCLFRTWAYCVARHAAYSHKRSAMSKHEELHSQFSSQVQGQAQVQGARSTTRPWLKTEVKQAFAHLRERLSEEDQEILFLRINRRMSWEEIACILAEEGTPQSPEALRKRCNVLRKRFQRLKEALRQMAEEHGLIPPSQEGEDSPPPQPQA
jgi:RNA polymerase sigma-70 factor, ECF subfamily